MQDLLAGLVDPTITLVHVIHRRKAYETQTEDYEFSRLSMTEHWQAGLADMAASFALLRRQPAPRPGEFRVLDYRADIAPPRRTAPGGRAAINTPESLEQQP